MYSIRVNDKYAWVGANQAKIIILQDFYWSSEFIASKDLLLLLEVETVKLPSPIKQSSSDVCVCIDIPAFPASKQKWLHVLTHFLALADYATICLLNIEDNFIIPLT